MAANVISEHEFLSSDECTSMMNTLRAHAEVAIDRFPAEPGTFLTYGRAAYLDVCLEGARPQHDYVDVVEASNQKLTAMYGDFLDRLRSTAETLLDGPVKYVPRSLALPGVHVFRGASIRCAAEAGHHFDVQYQRLQLPEPLDANARPISITIPLRLPHNGSGLRVSNVTYEDYERAYRMRRITKLDDLVARRTVAYYKYRLGKLILHRDLIVHCLYSPGPILPTDERVTVQCHGVRCAGTWILYW